MTAFFLHLFIFIFGAAVGSFLNSVIHRLEKNESFLFKRSSCPSCKHILRWHDLIPVLSFLYLQGRCRYCSQKISWQYPTVEIATGLLFLLIFNFQFSIFNQFPIFNFQSFLFSIFYFLISIFLIVIFVYDLKHYIIPDKIVYPAIAISLFYRLFAIWNLPAPLKTEGFLIGGFGILPSLLFLAIILLSRGIWMGMGDFKLAILMGLILGFPNILVALFLAFFSGAIIGIALIIVGQKTFKSEVPFGPFLITGTFIALFWGEKITNWYLNLFV
jgi:prepilin signal peptidase PulO-like enzyme (type II secretory pathway)